MIYTAAVAAALAGIAAASPAPAPAPQMLDFGAIAAAPTVATGPTGLAVQQNASIIADVTVTATAAPGATGLSKRDPTFGLFVDAVQAWECLFFHNCKTSAVASTTSTKSTAPVYFTSAVATSTSAKLSSYPSSTSAAVSSSQSSSAASSVTAAPVTGTSTTSSSTACPTQPEEGTYCGFINPEDPCAPQPDGYGPVPTPDTVSAFYAYPSFHSMAQAAPTQVPSVNNTVYSKVFQDLNASVSANSYIGLYTLQSYDASACAAHCDSTDLCTAFNLYIERDPSVAPSTNASTEPTVWGRDCPNPASITNYKCTLYGSAINSTMATNQGGYREQFQTVIVGSDGYVNTGIVPVVSVSTPPATASATASVTSSAARSTLATSAKPTATSSAPVPSWGSAHNCGSKGVNNGQHFMGGRYFPGPFNPQLCADLAWAQNAANKAAAVVAGKKNWTPCTYINAAYYHKDGVPHGTQCNMYDLRVDASFETYVGGFSAGHNFGCAQSFTFELKVDASFSTC